MGPNRADDDCQESETRDKQQQQKPGCEWARLDYAKKSQVVFVAVLVELEDWPRKGGFLRFVTVNL